MFEENNGFLTLLLQPTTFYFSIRFNRRKVKKKKRIGKKKVGVVRWNKGEERREKKRKRVTKVKEKVGGV